MNREGIYIDYEGGIPVPVEYLASLGWNRQNPPGHLSCPVLKLPSFYNLEVKNISRVKSDYQQNKSEEKKYSGTIPVFDRIG
jgi:hypothetical protein